MKPGESEKTEPLQVSSVSVSSKFSDIQSKRLNESISKMVYAVKDTVSALKPQIIRENYELRQ